MPDSGVYLRRCEILQLAVSARALAILSGDVAWACSFLDALWLWAPVGRLDGNR